MKKSLLVFLTFFTIIINCTAQERMKGFSDEWKEHSLKKILNVTSSSSIYDIQFLDSNNGIVAYSNKEPNPALLKTTDAGKTWKTIFEDNAKYYYDSATKKYVVTHRPVKISELQYLDSNNIFITCFDPGFISTENGKSDTVNSDSYFIQYNKIKKDFEVEDFIINGKRNTKVYSLKMFDQDNGYIFTLDGIFTTNDACKTWKAITAPYNFAELLVLNSYISKDSYIICKARSNIDTSYKLIVMDKNFKKAEIFEAPDKNWGSFYFINKNEGWYCSSEKHGTYQINIYKTIDGAKTWKKQLEKMSFIKSEYAVYLKMHDSKYGVLTSANSTAYITKDGGDTWSVSNPYSDSLNYSFGSSCITSNGKIFTYGIWTGSLYIYTPKVNPINVIEEFDVNSNFDLKLYPNPSSSIIKVEKSNFDLNLTSIMQYQILDLSGKLISSNNFSDEIDVSNLQNGIYFVKINSFNQSKSFKIEVTR